MRYDIASMFDNGNYGQDYAEKVAEVEENVTMFMKVAEEEGVDLSGLTPDQIVESANEWADELRAEAAGAEGDEGVYEDYDPALPEGPENIGPKTAEVDFLGRYMAHAKHDESIKIATEMTAEQPDGQEKEASFKEKLLGAIKGKGLGKSLQRARAAAGVKFESMKKIRAAKKGGDKTEVARLKGEAKQMAGPRGKAYGQAAKRLAGAAALPAAVVGGAGAAGYAAGRKKKSHVELLDEAAVDRANEILEVAGEGHDLTFDKVAGVDETDLDRVITELAWAKLEEAGHIQ